jgi:TRAP-type C4-dicarboxylate transport system permease small subunit
LLCAFFGAALAVEQQRHIRVDAVPFSTEPGRLLPPLYLLSAVVCVLLAGLPCAGMTTGNMGALPARTSVLALISPFGSLDCCTSARRIVPITRPGPQMILPLTILLVCLRCWVFRCSLHWLPAARGLAPD